MLGNLISHISDWNVKILSTFVLVMEICMFTKPIASCPRFILNLQPGGTDTVGVPYEAITAPYTALEDAQPCCEWQPIFHWLTTKMWQHKMIGHCEG